MLSSDLVRLGRRSFLVTARNYRKVKPGPSNGTITVFAYILCSVKPRGATYVRMFKFEKLSARIPIGWPAGQRLTWRRTRWSSKRRMLRSRSSSNRHDFNLRCVPSRPPRRIRRRSRERAFRIESLARPQMRALLQPEKVNCQK